MKIKQQRALDRLALHLRMQSNFAKTKAFFQWKELCNMNYTQNSSGGGVREENLENLLSSIGLSRISQNGKLSKLQKKAIRKMDEVVLTKMSAFFTQWKLKTLLLRGTK